MKIRLTGDIDICYANTQYDLTKMGQNTWNWQTKNPNGYQA